ncbi:helix-turn-helix domain-containing protein [Streptomyces sp. NPDC001312]|uniref:helix-turn-helix domain-containing protein n=1 Tax=Streptomyces sp. NPDC001312 TaxID=3364561 RepID=UPI003684E805
MQTTVRERRVPPAGLGEALRQARESAGLSQGDVAAAVGVRPDYVSKLERGLRCPSVSVASALVRMLHPSGQVAEALAVAAVPDAGRDHPARRGEMPCAAA